MPEKHKISEYIADITFKKSFGWGFRPDEVYDVICNINSMYGELMAEVYGENDELKEQISALKQKLSDERIARINSSGVFAREGSEREPAFGSREYFAREFTRRNRTDEYAQSETVSFINKEKQESAPEEAPSPASLLERMANAKKDAQKEEELLSSPPEAEADEEKDDKKKAPVRLQHLRRSELLELLIEQSRENETLKKQLSAAQSEKSALEEKLLDRKIKIDNAGTLAEASLLINGVLESSQQAAQQYLDNLQDLYDREKNACEKKEAEAEEYSQKIISEAKRQSEELRRSTEDKCAAITQVTRRRCESMRLEAEDACKSLEQEAKQKCADMETLTSLSCAAKEKQTAERCAALEENTRRDTEKYWTDLTDRLEEFYKAHEGLRELLDSTGHIPRI